MDKKKQFLELSKIKLRGTANVKDMKFHDIEGGFGENKKSMSVKDISFIHGREQKEVNRLINNNRKRFIDGKDILDLKVGDLKSLSLELGYTNQSYSNANNIYILSERGYSKLLKIMDDELAWEKYDELVDGYFDMRQAIPQMSKELQAIFTLDSRTMELDGRITKLENNATIDYSQQEELRELANKKIIAVLGGADAPAYKELNKKVFSGFWRDYKRKLKVNSYKNTLIKDYEIGRQAIINWQPTKEIKFMIDGCNAQMRL